MSFAVRCSLCVARCLWFVGCWLLCVDCCCLLVCGCSSRVVHSLSIRCFSVVSCLSLLEIVRCAAAWYYCVLFVAWYLLFVERCLLFVINCSLCCSLPVVCCLLVVVSCLSFVVCCRMRVVCCVVC